MEVSTGRLRRGLRRVVATAGAATLVGTLGLASPAAAGDARILQDHEVTIDLFAFTPQVLEVTAGQTVRWTNVQPDVPHTVTHDGTGVGSPVLQTGDTWEVMFTLPIDDPIEYHCEIHPTMTGTVIVTAP